jgi:hypothetical protein
MVYITDEISVEEINDRTQQAAGEADIQCLKQQRNSQGADKKLEKCQQVVGDGWGKKKENEIQGIENGGLPFRQQRHTGIAVRVPERYGSLEPIPGTESAKREVDTENIFMKKECLHRNNRVKEDAEQQEKYKKKPPKFSLIHPYFSYFISYDGAVIYRILQDMSTESFTDSKCRERRRQPRG